MMATQDRMRGRAHDAIGPLCQAVPAREVESWIAAAQPGDGFVYATGPAPPQGMASVCMVRELVEAGLVRTHMRRAAGTRVLEHIAIRREAGAVAQDDAPDVAGDDDPRGGDSHGIGRRMLQLLNKAALTGRPCPTNAELAEALGLKNKMAAQYVFQQLVRSGKIRVADFGPRMRRVVTICATGNSTRRGVSL